MASLITGIGYIGSRLAELLLDSGETVVGLDNLFSTELSAIRRLAELPNFTFIEGDVSDETAVERAFDSGAAIDTVYHLAGQSSAHHSAASMRYTEESNLIGPRVVLEQACEAGATTFVFGSSLQLYGRKVAGVVDESHPFGPLLDMSHLSKLHAEKLMEMFSINRGLRCISARLGLVYGLGPVMKTDARFMTAPNKFCRQAALGEPIRIDENAFYPTSMIHLDDAATGLAFLSTMAGNGFQAVNLLGETASVAQAARLVAKLAGQRGLRMELHQPATEPELPAPAFRSALDGSPFTPRFSLERDLGAVLDHFLTTEAAPSREERS